MNWVEFLGYLAVAVTLSSFAVKDMLRLRILNGLGALLWVVYGLLLGSNPVVLTNACIIVLHGYWFLKRRD